MIKHSARSTTAGGTTRTEGLDLHADIEYGFVAYAVRGDI
jgi:hypothetical protein